MAMKNNIKLNTAIIGGGASGLFLASLLSQTSKGVAVFERGERVGKKLSATGNGQGNITNALIKETAYFSSTREGAMRAEKQVNCYDENSLCEFFRSLGVLVFFDERGRGYPTSRQASALTDALRYSIDKRGVSTFTGVQIVALEKRGDTFILTANSGEKYEAEKVALCTGGKAAKNFGTDGAAYALAQGFGHTITPLYPSLVQLKTDTAAIRGLKGIRVFDAKVTANWTENGAKKSYALGGDVIFTDYGVSGDAIFRLSAFIAAKKDVSLSIDFLPNVDEETLLQALKNKKAAFPDLADIERLCGIVNNQVGRAVMKTVGGAKDEVVAKAVKNFTLSVKGSLGFDYAQVTKGGIPLDEVDDNLQSKKVKGLYFAGEILDIDGECGGFNLQWAYASACTVAKALGGK